MKNPATAIKIEVQQVDFSVESEYGWLREQGGGAVCLFSGLVRPIDNDIKQSEQRLILEHYSGMAETQLHTIARNAATIWALQAITVIHRYGSLMPSEQIVLTGVASRHRSEAFAACEYIMDFLKTDASFWKKELSAKSSCWVQNKQTDQNKRDTWKSRVDTN